MPKRNKTPKDTKNTIEMHYQIMQMREDELGKLIEFMSEKTNDFTKPKLILIGGYALRKYIPESRFSKDCDFVFKSVEGVDIWAIRGWANKELQIGAFKKEKEYGFIKFKKIIETKNVKIPVSIDIYENQIRGRKGELIILDDKFVNLSRKERLKIGSMICGVFVPSYPDFFLTKVIAMRKRDVRDIALMIKNNGIPMDIESRSKELCVDSKTFKEKIVEIIHKTEEKEFLSDLHGAFQTAKFTEEDRKQVVLELEKLLEKFK